MINAPISSQRSFDRRFYLVSSVTFFALVFWAFSKSYFLKGFFGSPVLSRLVHIHGLVMSGWVVLLLVQTCLVASHRIRWHRRLGTFGAVWATMVVVLGSITTLHAAAREVRERSEIASFQVSVLGLELLQMLLFACIVGAAIWLRQRADYHKRLMLLTTACMLPSVISRLPFDIHGFQSIYVYLLLFVLLAVGTDTFRNRRLHPAFGWGATLVLVVIEIGILGSASKWWQAVGTALVS